MRYLDRLESLELEHCTPRFELSRDEARALSIVWPKG